MKPILTFAMLLASYGLFTDTALAQTVGSVDQAFKDHFFNARENDAPPAGDIVAASPVPVSLTAEQVKAFALGSIDPALIPLVEAVFNFDYDIKVWKVLYTSRNIAGALVNVSGLIIIPHGLAAPAPVGAYAHGTIFADREAPANLASLLTNDQTAIGLAFATGGYVMFLSDYQAHGDSGGPFSLYVAQLEANDILNGLLATQRFCGTIGTSLNGNVSLYGFSQGAHAVLAAQRAMEQHPIPGLNLLVNIAGAGPYDLSGTQLRFLFDNPQYPNPAIIAGITEGYQNVYGNVYQHGQPPYAEPFLGVPALYNRQLTRDEINQQLAELELDAWTEMYRPAFLRSLKINPFNPLRADLRLNNVYDWRPEKDVKLCYCSEDELVTPRNTFRTLLSFYLRGATNARAVPLGPYSHFPCAQYATLYAKLIFDSYNGRFDNLSASATSEKDSRQVLATQVGLKEYDWLALKNDFGQKVPSPEELSEEPRFARANDQILVYPNPVKDLAYLRLPIEGGNINLQLYDRTGRLIKSIIAEQPVYSIDVSDMPEGVYLIKLQENQAVSARFIVGK